MKQLLLTYLFLLTTVLFCCGQQGCKCTENKIAGITDGQHPDSSFHFSNGNTIILCGFKDPDSKPATFSEFTLSICGQDTIIDFWAAVLTCQLRFRKDTLVIEDLRNLPAANERKYQIITWTIEKIYFVNGVLHRRPTTNRKIRKYSLQEIQQTIKEYETAKPGLNDNKMELANRLFLSAISGDKKARLYFADFKTKFGRLDGAFSEEYSDLASMLELWDKEK